jgi:hypothetical protein
VSERVRERKTSNKTRIDPLISQQSATKSSRLSINGSSMFVKQIALCIGLSGLTWSSQALEDSGWTKMTSDGQWGVRIRIIVAFACVCVRLLLRAVALIVARCCDHIGGGAMF